MLDAQPQVLTVLEHQSVPVTTDGAGWSLAPGDVERLAALNERRPGFCEIGHRRVRFAQFCGVARLGGRMLEVLPKTEAGDGDAETCKGVLLRLLRLSGEGLAAVRPPSAGQGAAGAPLLDVFIASFLDAVSFALRGGLIRQYMEHEEDVPVVRGRVRLERQWSVHAGRPDRVACAFDELTADNVWNRLLKKALRATRSWIHGAELNRRWIEWMGVFDEVDDERLDTGQVDRLVFDRQAERYRDAVEWARRILGLLSPSLRAGRLEAPALLFDMNRLFESAVAAVLRRRAGIEAPHLRVSVQEASRSLATIVGAGREEPGVPLVPDLLVRRGPAVVAIADTKWKLLEHDRQGRLKPREGDLYQMHAYASAFRCEDLALIYPWHPGLEPATETALRLPAVDGRTPTLRMLCLDIHDDALPLRCGGSPGPIGQLLTRG